MSVGEWVVVEIGMSGVDGVGVDPTSNISGGLNRLIRWRGLSVSMSVYFSS